MSQRPEWMSDPLVKDIPQKKLDFLGKMFDEGHGKSQKEMMTFMMPMPETTSTAASTHSKVSMIVSSAAKEGGGSGAAPAFREALAVKDQAVAADDALP